MKPEKKILIISYYWPPAGGPGVQRWLKFVKYLPEFGWTPTLFIPENPSYPLLDDSLMAEIPPDVQTIKTKIWEPYQIAEKLSKSNKKYKAGQFDTSKNQNWKSKLSVYIRGNFFIPDARKFWVKPSVKYLKNFLKKHDYDVLVTTGPPHSLHLIGLEVKKHFPDLTWVADFRDPWTEISYYEHLKLTSSADAKHRKLEQSVFNHADFTLATSYTDAANFRKKGANAFCITNGYDGEVQIASAHEKSEHFTLSYIGVLEQLRNPEMLWQVLEEILKENAAFKRDFELKFVGKIDPKILNTLKASVLKDHINHLGYLPHAASALEMAKSNLLLIVNFPEEKSAGIIPGKLYEYLQTGKTIISIGPKESDVKTILDKTASGKHFFAGENEALKNELLAQYTAWKSKKVISTERDLSAFSRRSLTKQLASLLNQNKSL